MPDHQLHDWVRAKIALFSRYADAEGNRLRLAETDYTKAKSLLYEERDRVANDVAGSNTITALSVLEAVLLSIPTLTDAKDTGEALVESAEKAQSAGADADDNVTNQQRIYLLEDQLAEANDTIGELRERLAQYESYDVDDQPDEDDAPSPESIADSNRYSTVLNAATGPGRFSRLRFLTNAVKPLEDYGKPRPNGVEILQALDAINRLAESWHETPSRNIGSWAAHFVNLPGWKYAADESETTMGLHGEKRSFSDQEVGRQITITRHLTYKGSSGGLQIYFDQDDATDKFMVGYIGEHLSYASSRS